MLLNIASFMLLILFTYVSALYECIELYSDLYAHITDFALTHVSKYIMTCVT